MPTIILKRLVIWLAETSCEIVLLIALELVLWGSSERSLLDDLGLLFFGTAIVFMIGSGYLLTTGVFGVIWRSRRPCVYPAIAAALFVIHVQFFATGWTLSTKVPIQVGGACIVFTSTLIGNRYLRKWGNTGVKRRPSVQHQDVPSDAHG